MADLSSIKKGRRFGTPPAADEASSNLGAPETAPIAPEPTPKAARPAPKEAEPVPAQAPTTAAAPGMDFRYMRRSKRTVTLATRVTPDFDNTVRQFAQTKNLTIVEVLEAALEAYKREQASI